MSNDWKRGLQTQKHLCVCTNGEWQDSGILIPVIQALMERVVCDIWVLIVLPTKELAQQICKVFSSYAEGTSLKVVILAGQSPLPQSRHRSRKTGLFSLRWNKPQFGRHCCRNPWETG